MINRKYKKAQIGETMTWVVATIIIIVILGIAIFFVQFNLKDRKFIPFLSNDLIVTKSAIGFLKYDSNFQLIKNSIKNDNYDLLKPKVESFLKTIPGHRSWNFRIFVNNKLGKDSSIVHSFPSSDSKYAYFTFNLGADKINLKFDEGRGKGK